MQILQINDPAELVRNGQTQLAAGRYTEALADFEAALQLQPNAELPMTGLATAHFQLGAYGQAAATFERLARLVPQNAQYHYNHGYCRLLNHEYDAAELILRRAAEVLTDPHVAANYALALHWSTHPDDARSIELLMRSAIALPGDLAIQTNLAHLLLATGDFERGWRQHERRPTLQSMLPKYEVPMWRGESLGGTNLLLWCEPGFGNALQFVRYVPALAARAAAEGGTLMLLAQPELHALFAASFAALAPTFTVVHPGSTILPYHWHCSLLSLPERMHTTLATIPADVPYLAPPAGATAEWRERLQGVQGLKAGLVWADGSQQASDTAFQRGNDPGSTSLERLSPLLDVPGITFFSLQQGTASAQVDAFRDRANLFDYSAELQTFADTAALVTQLDLVIAVDADVCHLAGALDRPVWLLNRHPGSWRWLRGRDDTPWYPRMRLFRQESAGEWDDQIARVRAALETAAVEWVAGGS
ncbi:MAG: tetratricopeptide repeat protein [Betaproteobacteria bacterium]